MRFYQELMEFKYKLKGQKSTITELFFSTRSTRYLREFIHTAKKELEEALKTAKDLFVYGEFGIKTTDCVFQLIEV